MTMLGLPHKPLIIALVAGFIAGGYIGAFLAIRQPKLYMAEATIESPDHSNHDDEITLLRARMVERYLDLGNRWGITQEEAAVKICKAVQLKPIKDQGVLIEVRHEDPRDASNIASCVAAGLDSPLREQEMANRNPTVRFDPQHIEELQKKMDYLIWQLDNRAIKAGFDDFLQLRRSAAGASDKAREVVSEDVTLNWIRQLTEAETESDRISKDLESWNPPGEPFKTDNSSARFGPIPQSPVSPNPKVWVYGGRYGGALTAFLILLAINHWRPLWLRPVPRLPDRIPDSAEVGSTKEDPW